MAAVVAAQNITIVASFPVYDVVLKEAFPNATVILLTKGVSDPHEYQLTADDLRLLASLGPRDVVVVTMHAAFEQRIYDMAQRGEIKARVIDVRAFQTYLTFDGRPAAANGTGVNMHDHGVYPPNVLKLIYVVSNATGLRPDAKFLEELERLNATYCCKFGGRAVAITPMAEYILYWLGYRDIVVLIKEPEVPPSPQDVQMALQYAKEGAPVLAAVVSGERLRIVDQFVAKAQEAGFQPKVIVADFSKGYLSTLAYAASQIAAQQTATASQPSSASQATVVRPSAPQQTAAQPQTTPPWVWAAVGAVVAAVAAAAYLVARRR